MSGISELKAAVRDTQLTEWLDKKGLLHVKNILWSHGVLGLADLQHLDQEKADDIVKDMQATNDHHNFLSSVKLLKEELVPQDEVPRVRCELRVCCGLNFVICSVQFNYNLALH